MNQVNDNSASHKAWSRHLAHNVIERATEELNPLLRIGNHVKSQFPGFLVPDAASVPRGAATEADALNKNGVKKLE